MHYQHSEFDRWLSPPDQFSNANRARNLRHEGTGTWLLGNDVFRNWHSGTNRCLWLQGFAGCGKTILVTTILDHLPNDRSVLSFFFDFSDTAKQTLDSMLRSFVHQLCLGTTDSTDHLRSIYNAHQRGRIQPATATLSEALCKILASQNNPVIVIDALDEATTRVELLSWIKSIVSRPELDHVQILCSSRSEAEFMDHLSPLFGVQNCLEIDRQAVNADIRSYVTTRIRTDPEFTCKSLPPNLSDQIRDRIGDQADGM